MLTIKFSTNWNGKLNNKTFTTFRPHNPLHYRKGNLFVVDVNGRAFANAKIVAVETMKLHDITEFQARLDAGFSRREFIGLIRKLYKPKAFLFDRQLFDLILFEKTDIQRKISM